MFLKLKKIKGFGILIMNQYEAKGKRFILGN